MRRKWQVSRGVKHQIESLETRNLLAVDLLSDFSTGSPRAAAPSEITAIDDFVLFNADFQQSNGRQIWAKDGSTDGTVPIRMDHGMFRQQPFKNGLIYLAGDQLWRTNGTPETTISLSNPESTFLNSDSEFVVFGDHVYFVGRDPSLLPEDSPVRFRLMLMRSDGTAGNLEYFAPTFDESTGIDQLLGTWNDELYFVKRIAGGKKLFATDGTAAGTREIPYEDQLTDVSLLGQFDGIPRW